MIRVIHLIRCVGGVTALALAVPVIAQERAQPPVDPAEATATSGTTDLGQPEDPAAKRGFIRRQVGRIDNPDKAPDNAKPLPQPAKPGERQGFIRRQVGRIDNPDARRGQPLTSPAPAPGSTQPPQSDAPQSRSPRG
ncbi:hypothetical protein CHX26_09515 [Porphyrobacter sp. HT-58-2]|uniref:hypothetical protein n=1 Tax=Porphyrobacter sp. HT-58-2 TaxID=2023229 RepID=UPI000CDBFEC4|nr:hypothetical protein [Porphyrobacter sp. HT-58-2]AUX69704.1 hypothetical protein CHX26_09515 [Porphyrobacter sp. HT-58-2]